jgi:hypothetical protein
VARLTDPDRLAAYLDALANWAVVDYIQFDLNEEALRWIERELGASIRQKEIGELMHKHMAAGGEIDEVRETRPQWDDYEFHHDLRFTILGKRVYIETRLLSSPTIPGFWW